MPDAEMLGAGCWPLEGLRREVDTPPAYNKKVAAPPYRPSPQLAA